MAPPSRPNSHTSLCLSALPGQSILEVKSTPSLCEAQQFNSAPPPTLEPHVHTRQRAIGSVSFNNTGMAEALKCESSL